MEDRKMAVSDYKLDPSQPSVKMMDIETQRHCTYALDSTFDGMTYFAYNVTLKRYEVLEFLKHDGEIYCKSNRK
ncbi:MAG: hypothetical protein GY841_02835 [FCB group bacterium]|nr:hypothetical protein [FCB group bacterium]